VTSAAKAALLQHFIAALKALRHPKTISYYCGSDLGATLPPSRLQHLRLIQRRDGEALHHSG